MILVFFLFSFIPSLLPLLFKFSSISFSFSSLSADNIRSSANLRLLSLTPLMLNPALMFVLLKISSAADVNVTGDKCVTPMDSFHDLFLFTKLFCSYLCCSFGVHFFDDVNVPFLHDMCPQCLNSHNTNNKKRQNVGKSQVLLFVNNVPHKLPK